MTATTYNEKQRAFTAEIYRLAQKAHLTYFRNLTEMYLVGRKDARGIWAELDTATDPPEGWAVVHPEHFRRDMTAEQLAGFLRGWLSREPLFIFAD